MANKVYKLQCVHESVTGACNIPNTRISIELLLQRELIQANIHILSKSTISVQKHTLLKLIKL